MRCHPGRLRASILLLAVLWGHGRPLPAAAPPRGVDVTVRYRINLPQAVRPQPFYDFLRALDGAGFVKRGSAENEAIDRNHRDLTGWASAGRARNLIYVPGVQRVLLIPTDYGLPPNDTPVPVTLTLAGNHSLPTQRLLVDQIRPLLEKEGFREDIGYCHDNHTRVVGTIPANRLERLLNDPRPADPASLDLPLRAGWPVRRIEVRPTPPGIDPARPVVPRTAPPGNQQKFSADLRDLLGQKGNPARRVRVEVLFGDPAHTTNEELIRTLVKTATAPSIEYRLDCVVALQTPLNQVEAISQLPFVHHVRLPHPATPAVANGPTDGTAAARLDTDWKLSQLHAGGNRGQGVVVAVIDTDFRGYRNFLGKGLPASTRLVDLTAERTDTLEPEPEAEPTSATGAGTLQAMAASKAAPEAEVVLVRVAADGPFQLYQAAKYLTGDVRASPALAQRQKELVADEKGLVIRQQVLAEERRKLFDKPLNAEDREEREARADYDLRQAQFDKERKEIAQRRRRYLNYLTAIDGLRRVRVVACGLVWNTGWAVNGEGELAQLLDARRRCDQLWLQAGGDTAGQAWCGLYRDADDNGVMEFAAADRPLPPNRCSAELNFLGWQRPDGTVTNTLPANARVRLSVQWREVHDRLLRWQGGDEYQKPLANLGLLVLRQRDPEGATLPPDAFEYVDRSFELKDRRPQRLTAGPTTAVYEQELEFKTSEGGAFAVRVDGPARLSVRHPEDETLPGLTTTYELRPRIFAQVDAGEGRPVWLENAQAEGAFGTPADSREAVVVGALGADGPRPWSAAGSPFGMALRRRPDVLVPDGLPLAGVQRTGTAMSAAAAAGVAACAISRGSGCEALRILWHGSRMRGWPVRETNPINR